MTLMACAGCGGGASTSQKTVAIGVWGGDSPQAEMTVSSTGINLETGNGDGVVSERVMLDGSGNFDVMGTYTFVGGVPPPDGSTYSADPARYTGTASGNTMSLTVVVNPSTGDATTEGPFTLTYGKVVDVVPP
jgi:hypothetical protein